jgi:hypothetical protein
MHKKRGRENKTQYNCLFVVLVWIGYGMFYGLYYEGYTIIRALYFSVTALSTGGLQAPTVPVEPGDETFKMGTCKCVCCVCCVCVCLYNIYIAS